MDSITTVEQLVQSFDDADPEEQGRILRNINIPTSEFLEFASWTDECYTRNCIARCDKFEFILLCWDGNCKTKIHDHNGQDCWVYQVKGNLVETRFNGSEENLEVSHKAKLNPGDLSYMNDRMGYHRIENPDDSRAMTLHVYANPITQCQVFNEDTAVFETAHMEYDTLHEVVAVK